MKARDKRSTNKGAQVVGMWRFISEHRQQVAEGCWFFVALILFLLVGPFAAPVVVIALFSLPSEERGLSEPETLHDSVSLQLR